MKKKRLIELILFSFVLFIFFGYCIVQYKYYLADRNNYFKQQAIIAAERVARLQDAPIVYSNKADNLPNTSDSEEKAHAKKYNCEEGNGLDKTKYPMTINHKEGILGKGYLMSDAWGPEKGLLNGWYGRQLVFCNNDTFRMMFSGEGGDSEEDGYYEINDSQLSLYYKTSYSIYEDKKENTEEMNLTAIYNFKHSQTSPFKNDYLENINYNKDSTDISWNENSTDILWKQDSNVTEGQIRTIAIKDKIVDLYITKPNLVPKDGVATREFPSKDGRLLAHCSDGYTYAILPDEFTMILGRTFTKEYYNDKLDYWYYFYVATGPNEDYICVQSVTGEPESAPNFVWVHGSDLVEKKS
jgi:hypothetical protein